MTTFTCSYKIKADQDNNRLYLIIKGFLIDEYVKRAVKKITSEANKLKAGFDVIDDLSELNPATAQDADKIMRAHNYALKKGARRVIRIGNQEMKNIVKNTRNKYQEISAKTVEEAELLLN